MTDSRVFLVTGASGFVGRALCRALRGKGRVRGLFRLSADGPWDESVTADLAEGLPAGALDGVDTVFHLAAKTDDGRTPPSDQGVFQRVNAEGTARLVAAAAAAGVERFVLASSIKAMGPSGRACLDESAPARPTTPYGRSKKEAEDLVLGEPRVRHACVARAVPVYGAGSKGNLARMIEAMNRGLFPPLPETKNARSMVHVDDLARALCLCAEKPEAAGRVFIVTDGRGYSTREIYERVCEAAGRTPPRWSVPPAALRAAGTLGDALGRLTGRPFAITSAMVERLLGSAWYDSSLIARALGFAPEWNLERALPEMVRAAAPTGRAAPPLRPAAPPEG
jgi:nucleoside-diphosphate-sugar epimerase